MNPKNTPRYLINHLSLHFCFDKIDDLWFQVITSCHHQRLPEMVKTNLINIFDISTSGYIMILNLWPQPLKITTEWPAGATHFCLHLARLVMAVPHLGYSSQSLNPTNQLMKILLHWILPIRIVLNIYKSICIYLSKQTHGKFTSNKSWLNSSIS